MVREGIPMDKVLEVLKERYGEKVASVRKNAKTLGVARPSVQKYTDLSVLLGISHRGAGPEEAGALCDVQVQASSEEGAGAFWGEWLPEHIMAMGCSLEIYDAYRKQIASCDQMIEAHLATMERHAIPAGTKQTVRRTKNEPKFEVQTALRKMLGVDVTTIDGIGLSTALTIASEVGSLTQVSIFLTIFPQIPSLLIS